VKHFLLIFCCILFLGDSVSNAQDRQIKKIKRFRLNEVSLVASEIEELITETDRPHLISDFQKLFPASVLLNDDFSEFDYKNSNGLGEQLSGHGIFSVQAGFSIRNKNGDGYAPRSFLRFRLSYYGSATSLSGTFTKYKESFYDTLHTSSGPVYRYDVNRERYLLDYTSKQVRLDAAYIYKFKPGSRWSFHTGAGITGNFSFNPYTKIEYENSNEVTVYNTKDEYLYTNYSYFVNTSGQFPGLEAVTKIEKRKNKNNYGLSVYAPLIINFRIGREKEFWKRIHAFYELSGGITVTYIPELRTLVYPVVQNGLGLKYTWD
jgi:hypothetical protein